MRLLMLLISHYLQVVIMKKMFLQLDKRQEVLKKSIGKDQKIQGRNGCALMAKAFQENDPKSYEEA